MISPLLVAALALSAAPSPSAQAPAAYAVIVAHNQSSDGSLAPLQFADDDGARYAELLGLGTKQVTLLSVMDASTQALHPKIAAAARPPTRPELQAALQDTFAKIEADRAAGLRTVFYFVYVGHGSVGDDGEGAMHLLDARLSRGDLFQQVLAKSPATINHVIIDACHAYLMVARRGSSASTEAALKTFLKKEGLDAYPNTGVLLSTSRAKEVHEWSRFSAGIFSHELRSALAGAADVNGNGAITYSEARAFIAAANAQVHNPSARLEIFAQPPAMHLNEPIFDRAWAVHAPQVILPPQRAGRWHLEDARGVRFADFNSAPTESLTLTLVPQPQYFLRHGAKEIAIDLSTQRRINLAQLRETRVELAQRGSEALTFQRDLFALPFGRAYFEGYRAASPHSSAQTWAPPPASGLRTRRWVALGLAGAGVAAAATGVGLLISSRAQAERYQTFIGEDDELEQIRRRAHGQDLASKVLLATGGGLVTAALTAWFWPAD